MRRPHASLADSGNRHDGQHAPVTRDQADEARETDGSLLERDPGGETALFRDAQRSVDGIHTSASWSRAYRSSSSGSFVGER